jgi:hypothetical protein
MGEQGSTVWMVHARTGQNGLKGRLVLEGSMLVFRPDSKKVAETEFRLAEVKRVRGLRFSPVVELRLARPGSPPLVGFYFVKPPSLERPEGPRPFKKQSVRRRAARELREGNARKREEVAEWVQLLRRAVAG